MTRSSRLRLVPALFVLALLPGCIWYQQSTVLHGDGSGYFTARITQKVAPDDRKRGEFSESGGRRLYQAKGVTVERVQVSYSAKDSLQRMIVDVRFDDVRALTGAQAFQQCVIRWTEHDGRVTFEHQLAGPDASFAVTSVEGAAYDYEFPGTVLSCNADSIDGTHAFWKDVRADEQGRRIMRAEFEITPAWHCWLSWIGGAAVLALIVVVLRKRKRAAS